MAYLSPDDPNLLQDILSRKEYQNSKLDKHTGLHGIIPPFILEDQALKGIHLRLHSYQTFVKNFINPNTPYKRLLLKHDVGLGKTLSALSVAMNFIEYYKKEPEISDEIGSVFIIGFSDRIFKTELLRYPDFGFISVEELHQLDKLHQIATTSGLKLDSDKLHEFRIHIRKRFNNRKGNGFFKFFGYKAFVNRIFQVSVAHKQKINLSRLDENQIREYLKQDVIKFNEPLLKQFKNSLIICDEIHNTYNSAEKNNWGIAIQLVLDHHPTARALFMSATPLNNNPTEIVDLMNLLIPPELKIKKEDIFSDNELTSVGREKIAELSRGRVSFVRSINPALFPEKEMLGEKISGIPYLKFIRCPMSKWHYSTYKEVFTGTLPQESQYLMDFALPNPSSKKIGLYQTTTIKNELQYASQAWKDRHHIDFRDNRIVGEIAKKDHLLFISSKYTKMINDIQNLVRTQAGKILIYHNTVHMSGVLFIQEILLKNGFIDEFSNSHGNTLCVICGKYKKEHSKKSFVGGDDGESLEKNIMYNRQDKKLSYIEKDKELPLLTAYIIPHVTIVYNHDINMAPENYDIIIKHLLSTNNHILFQTDKINTKFHIVLKNHGFIHKICTDNYMYLTNMEMENVNDLDSLMDTFYDLAISGQENEHEKENENENENEKENENENENENEKENEKGKEKKGGKPSKEHIYIPARFIILHSDIDITQRYQSLDKYNAINNAFGHKFLILLGSRIIKESLDIKAVRNMLIMSRPDNIPMLKQIIGRAIRKNSHIALPTDMRTVKIKLYTSCLPVKDTNGEFKLSYEEEKYKKKIHQYTIIQEIEKILHENAVDAIINRDIIFNQKGDNDLFDLLPFEPSKQFKKQQFTLKELNLSTFNAFHSKTEVKNIILILKRLFTEISPVWTYNDLFYALKNPPSKFNNIIDFNTALIPENLFIIALNLLVFSQTASSVNIVNIDKINADQYSKIIIPVQSDTIEAYIIAHIGEYYVLTPFDTTLHIPKIDIETPYRLSLYTEPKVIHIESFLQNNPNFHSYKDQKNRFVRKWEHISFHNMLDSMTEYNSDFHAQLVEECISYIFAVWTSNPKKSHLHEFYFKMLYYYSLKGLILWAHTAKDFIYSKFTKYTTPVKIKLMHKTEKKNKEKKKDMSLWLSNAFKSSLNNISISSDTLKAANKQPYYQEYLNESLNPNRKKKIPADRLPIGHFMLDIPRLYIDSKWVSSPEYLEYEDYEENNIIIGYEEKIARTIVIKFKIRNPIHYIKKFKDIRMIEKGSLCMSKSKATLINIAKKMDIELGDKKNSHHLCEKIRRHLLYNEMKERVNKTHIKWYYMHYEKQPTF